MPNIEDLESLDETLAILSNPELMAEIREAERDVAGGRTKALTKDEAATRIKNRLTGSGEPFAVE